MIDLADYIVAGEIIKIHGVRGQLVLQLDNLSFENILKLESVIIEIDGLPVPFFIQSYSQRNNNSIILTIEDIVSERKANELVDKKVYFNTESIKSKKQVAFQTNNLTGYTVIDKENSTLGILEEILDDQYNPLLRITNGKKEILIPYQTVFIIKIEKKTRTIIVNPPLGLTELFD